MICPFCNTQIPDVSEVCPACRADLSMTRSFAALEGDYCPSCGALVPTGHESCPSCGTPIARRVERREPPAWAAELPQIEERPEPSAEETTTIPRIESAISATGEYREDELAGERKAQPVPMLLVATVALAVVGGAALALSHPWDVSAYDQRATVERDTSQAGFPGVVDRLSGQDSDAGELEVVSGDQVTYEQLLDIYERLGALADRVDENVALFKDVATGADRDARAAGRSEAASIAIDVSNLISELDQVDVSSGTYAETAENLSSLGNWLRNRADTLLAAWDTSLAYDDPSAASGEISAALAVDDNGMGRNAYMSLFHDRYAGWAPAPPPES